MRLELPSMSWGRRGDRNLMDKQGCELKLLLRSWPASQVREEAGTHRWVGVMAGPVKAVS